MLVLSDYFLSFRIFNTSFKLDEFEQSKALEG